MDATDEKCLQLSLAMLKLLTDCVNIYLPYYQCIHFKEAVFVHAKKIV